MPDVYNRLSGLNNHKEYGLLDVRRQFHALKLDNKPAVVKKMAIQRNQLLFTT